MKQCGQDGSPAQRGMKYGRMMASAHWHPSSTREEAWVAGRTKQGACCCSSGKREEVRARARKRQRCDMLALHRQAQQGKSILARLRQSSNKQWWHAGVSTLKARVVFRKLLGPAGIVHFHVRFSWICHYAACHAAVVVPCSLCHSAL